MWYIIPVQSIHYMEQYAYVLSMKTFLGTVLQTWWRKYAQI